MISKLILERKGIWNNRRNFSYEIHEHDFGSSLTLKSNMHFGKIFRTMPIKKEVTKNIYEQKERKWIDQKEDNFKGNEKIWIAKQNKLKPGFSWSCEAIASRNFLLTKLEWKKLKKLRIFQFHNGKAAFCFSYQASSVDGVLKKGLSA